MRRVAAALAVAFGVGAATLLPGAAPALAATPHYVALVVAGHGTYCVRAGGSGDSVLNAVVEVGYRPSDHIIWQIDNYPSPPYTNSTHYWSYWHDTRGSWSYATTGANSYTPPAGSVEGWIFGNGSAPPPRNPSGLYAALCGYLDAPPPASSSPVVHRSTTAPRPTSRAPAPTTAPHHATPSRRSVAPSPSTSAARSHPRSSPPAAHLASSTSAGQVSLGLAPSTLAPSTPSPATTSTHAATTVSHGSAVPAVVGVGLAAVVAAGGGWAAWRRRRG